MQKLSRPMTVHSGEKPASQEMELVTAAPWWKFTMRRQRTAQMGLFSVLSEFQRLYASLVMTI